MELRQGERPEADRCLETDASQLIDPDLFNIDYLHGVGEDDEVYQPLHPINDAYVDIDESNIIERRLRRDEEELDCMRVDSVASGLSRNT